MEIGNNDSTTNINTRDKIEKLVFYIAMTGDRTRDHLKPLDHESYGGGN